MNTIFLLLVAGGISGLLYFGGLWWTVRNLAEFRHPAVVYLGSLMLRLAALVGVVWLAIQYGQGLAIVAFLVGFIAVRMVIVHRLKPT